MPDDEPGEPSPIGRHASTPQELKERILLERAGAVHLVYRDAAGGQVLVVLASLRKSLTIGREGCDITLGWDNEVSRLHAQLELVGRYWTVLDDGSRNGSFVNGERLQGRHRLREKDTLQFGRTVIVFRSPKAETELTTQPGTRSILRGTVNEEDRSILIELCRPLKDSLDNMPASNRAIADRLYLTLPTVKRRLSGLFVRFGLSHLPQSEKRRQLALESLRTGIVMWRDL
jgi:pSer/pThr/pTyr-binding forkhead associated (FHA) protein